MSLAGRFGKIGSKPQKIEMGDATYTLTLALLTSTELFVDAQSSGTEKLILPVLADIEGLPIRVYNTGGESILVRDSGDTTTIVTVVTGTAALVCVGPDENDALVYRAIVGA